MSASISPEFVERYQLEYQKNPRSRIFAPLAEAYRQMGLLSEALQLCVKGVQIHPEFAGGRVAYARVLLSKGDKNQALSQLEKAAQISPDNLLAQSLLAETLLEFRRPKDALKAFKMVLFINPSDERALSAVRKWEFLSADEYDEELFKMKPLFEPNKASQPPLLKPEEAGSPLLKSPTQKSQNDSVRHKREVERAVSLADAFTVRGDFGKAQQLLERARGALGSMPEIDKRLGLLVRRSNSLEQSMKPQAAEALADDVRAARVQKLETFLQRITERRQ